MPKACGEINNPGHCAFGEVHFYPNLPFGRSDDHTVALLQVILGGRGGVNSKE